MNIICHLSLSIWFMMGACCLGAEPSSDARNKSGSTGRAATTQPTSHRINIDPRAEKALRSMSDKLAGARALSFHALTTMDEPVDTGQMAQSSREVKVVMRRPDRVFIETHPGDDVWLLWYNGREITLLDKTANTFASTPAPGNIDEMLDDVAEKHGLTLPLADLLFSDPYKALTAEVLTGRYVGLHLVAGVKCHHLLFTQEGVDWQIWIDAGESPVPRKLVIDYKSVPGRPQFSAVLSNWNLSAAVKDEQFQPVLAKDAKKTELKKLLEVEGEK